MKCLPLLVPLSALSPSSPSERLDRSEGGNTGRRTQKVLPLLAKREAAVRSAPGRSTECGGYKGFQPKRKRWIGGPTLPSHTRTCGQQADFYWVSADFQGRVKASALPHP